MISGMQVDAWGAFVPERADMADKIKEELLKEVEKRGLENLTISTQELGVGTSWQALTGEKREHIVFEQGLGRGAAAAFALRVAPRGTNDLEISWRLFEGNLAKSIATGTSQTVLVVFGILWTLMSARSHAARGWLLHGHHRPDHHGIRFRLVGKEQGQNECHHLPTIG